MTKTLFTGAAGFIGMHRATSADTTELDAWVGCNRATPVCERVSQLALWCQSFFGACDA